MIPIRVVMKGWMRYRDEQVADFSHGRLISICGENGTGKSSIFDAITYALYGQHRLGKTQVEQLISQDENRLSVEFEFEANGERYLVRRSRGRKESERDQGLWSFDNAGPDQWTPVAGTQKDDALRRTLDHIVRLSPEAFTSSFLLQQGAATEFLDADPQPRFRIVAGLIGLHEYELLEKRARDAQKIEKQRLEDLKNELAKFGGVDAASLAELQAEAAAAAASEASASQALLAARAQLADAQRYTRLAAEIATLDEEIAIAEQLIVQKDAIEKDALVFQQLSDASEKVARVGAAIADASREEAAAKDARGRAGAIDIDALAAAHVAAATAATSATADAATAATAHTDAVRHEREAADFAVVAEAYLAARAHLGECDQRIVTYDGQLATLPQLEQEAAALRAIKEALPALRLLREAYEHLESLQTTDAAAALKKLARERKSLDAEMLAGERAVLAAEKLLDGARSGAAAASARVTQLEQQRAERMASSKESTCSRCGQAIDKQRAKSELAELTAELAAAKAEATSAVADERAAVAARTSAQNENKRLAAAIVANTAATNGATASRDECARATKIAMDRRSEFEQVAPQELVAAVPAQISSKALAPLLATHADVPQRADAAAGQVAALGGIGGERTAAIAERARTDETLAAHGATLGGRIGDAATASATHATTKKQLLAASQALDGATAAAERARKAEAAAASALGDGREQRLILERESERHEQEAAGHRRAAAAFTDGLGELAASALADPSGTRAMLKTHREQLAGAPARKKALDAAREQRASAAAQRAAKDDEIEAIPAPHRIAADVGAAAANAADAACAEAKQALTAAQHALATLQARIGQLADLREQKAAVEARWKLLKTLVKLLGKQGLQGMLVTSALDTIKNHANAFLQRLTGGSLQLTIQREGDALELQAIDSTCMREPRSVRVLSGSQKFRCAVAIASGIGQYAGAGGMRSIVIDEGFGSLDDTGQQTMVDELKQLATHMEKVIVVSHLDAFKDPADFPDRLIVKTSGSGSRIERVG